MSVEKKLEAWRQATEQLTPSSELLAKLDSIVASPPAGTPVRTRLKLVWSTFVVAALLGVAWFAAPRWTSRLKALINPCPAAEKGGWGGILVAPMSQELLQQKLLLLETRPLTCEGQRQPLMDVLTEGQSSLTFKQRNTFLARSAMVCSDFSFVLVAPPSPLSFLPCEDDPTWCYQPGCRAKPGRVEEAEAEFALCRRSLAAMPATTCIGRDVRLSLLRESCVDYLTHAEDPARRKSIQGWFSELRNAYGKDALDEPWCFQPEAREEASRLRALGVKPTLPPTSIGP